MAAAQFAYNPHPAWPGYVLAACMGACIVMQTTCINSTFFSTSRLGVRIKAGITAAVYRKAIRLRTVGSPPLRGQLLLSLVRAAKRRGLFVVGADLNPQAVGVKHTDEFHEVSTNDVERLAGLVHAALADAITTTGSEVSLKATAQVAERLHLPFYADPETVRRCHAPVFPFSFVLSFYLCLATSLPAALKYSRIDPAYNPGPFNLLNIIFFKNK